MTPCPFEMMGDDPVKLAMWAAFVRAYPDDCLWPTSSKLWREFKIGFAAGMEAEKERCAKIAYDIRKQVAAAILGEKVSGSCPE